MNDREQLRALLDNMDEQELFELLQTLQAEEAAGNGMWDSFSDGIGDAYDATGDFVSNLFGGGDADMDAYDAMKMAAYEQDLIKQAGALSYAKSLATPKSIAIGAGGLAGLGLLGYGYSEAAQPSAFEEAALDLQAAQDAYDEQRGILGLTSEAAFDQDMLFKEAAFEYELLKEAGVIGAFMGSAKNHINNIMQKGVGKAFGRAKELVTGGKVAKIQTRLTKAKNLAGKTNNRGVRDRALKVVQSNTEKHAKELAKVRMTRYGLGATGIGAAGTMYGTSR